MQTLFDLRGRVAVVVGATSGLGKTIACGLADHGAQVAAAGRRSNDFRVDVTSRESIEALRENVLDKFGRVDILVNAAGITQKRETIGVSDSDWACVIETNLNGALRTCQTFFEALKASGRGRIVNICSLGSFVAFHQVAAYCTSKTALLGLTRNLGCEWAPFGISVNAIVPGVFPTELNRPLIEGTPRGKEILMRTPMARFGNAEELIGAAVLLASDAASFITGQSIAVDGGYLASGVNC